MMEIHISRGEDDERGEGEGRGVLVESHIGIETKWRETIWEWTSLNKREIGRMSTVV